MTQDYKHQGRFKTSTKEETAGVVAIARELELEVEPKAVTELLQPHDKTLTDEELFLMDEQRKWKLLLVRLLK